MDKVIDIRTEKGKQEYYNSFKWKLVTTYMIGKYHSCQKCKELDIKKLLVHHTSYANYPHEKEEDLLVLCKACHFNHHEKGYKYSQDEEREFRQLSLSNASGKTINLNEISGIEQPFVANNKSIFECEFCGRKLDGSYEYQLNSLFGYHRDYFLNLSIIPKRNYKRKSIVLCMECREKLDEGYRRVIKITPKLASILLTDPPTQPTDKVQTKLKEKNGKEDKNRGEETQKNIE